MSVLFLNYKTKIYRFVIVTNAKISFILLADGKMQFSSYVCERKLNWCYLRSADELHSLIYKIVLF